MMHKYRYLLLRNSLKIYEADDRNNDLKSCSTLENPFTLHILSFWFSE